MRRNALCLSVSLVLTLCSFGCAKKNAGMDQTALDDVGAYNAPATQTAPTTDPYPTYGSPSPVDRSASMASSYPSEPSSSGARYHTVVKKDTLFGLARQYYGDASKWKDIYEANRGKISDPNRIRVGDRLVIP